ncbi:MAG: hypothetical protein ACFE0R_10455 [Salinarimonas sp.]
MGTRTRAELLAAESRRLSAEGYDVIVAPDATLLPAALRTRRPDAIALGRDPKLVIEITGDRPGSGPRLAALQEALRAAPGWQLYLVLDRASPASIPRAAPDADIEAALDRVPRVATVDTGAALMLAWSALEGIVRNRRPETFARPQTTDRLVEHLAAEGIVLPDDAAFLRDVAARRNAVAHGDVRESPTAAEVARLVDLVRSLIASPDLARPDDVLDETTSFAGA